MSANFIDVRFPPRISLGAEGGDEFNTDIVVIASGFETRNQNWEKALRRYDVAHAARREEDWKQLRAFFLAMRGRACSFRFKDWTDYVCESGDGTFIDADGSPSAKQMVKTYTFQAQTYQKIITKPINGKVTVVGGGSVDYSTGIVAGSPTSWYGEFDLHCRFDTDRMVSLTIDRSPDGELLVGWQSIPIVEVRE